MTDTIEKDNNKNTSINEVSVYGVYSDADSEDKNLETVFTNEKDATLMMEYFYKNSRRKCCWTVEEIETFESFEDAKKIYNVSFFG